MPQTFPEPGRTVNGGGSSDGSTPIFATALAASLVGTISVLASDFGGWYERIAFGITPIQRWHYIGLLENPVQFIVFAATAAALGYSGYVAITALRSKSYPSAQILRNCLVLSATAAVVLLVIAIIFAVETLPDEPEDWWFDTGFYGGLIGSGVAAAMFWVASRKAPTEAADSAGCEDA